MYRMNVTCPTPSPD